MELLCQLLEEDVLDANEKEMCLQNLSQTLIHFSNIESNGTFNYLYSFFFFLKKSFYHLLFN